MSDIDHIELLLVEDDPGHATLIRRNLRRAGIANEITHFENGRLVLEHLDAAPADAPVLLLLDLNMPELDGYGTLERMRDAPHLRDLPVIVLTTTSEPMEVDRCYQLGCNAFVTKPIDYQEFTAAVQRLGRFLSIAQFPDGRRMIRQDSHTGENLP